MPYRSMIYYIKIYVRPSCTMYPLKIIYFLTSSDDDIEVILHGTPEQKRKLQTKVQQRHDSSSEDDFEKEMNNELNKHIKGLEHERSKSNVAETIKGKYKSHMNYVLINY